MNNLNPKILYWIFLAVFIVGLVNSFWFNVFFSPLLVVLFFIALNFSIFPAISFSVFYGIFLDIVSSAPFGQHTLGFVLLCVVFFLFRKIFTLKSSMPIFLFCLVISMALYVLFLYFWGMLFAVTSGLSWPSMQNIFQQNIFNLAANSILILPVYVLYFLKQSKYAKVY